MRGDAAVDDVAADRGREVGAADDGAEEVAEGGRGRRPPPTAANDAVGAADGGADAAACAAERRPRGTARRWGLARRGTRCAADDGRAPRRPRRWRKYVGAEALAAAGAVVAEVGRGRRAAC
eukprot:gene52665-61633_t